MAIALRPQICDVTSPHVYHKNRCTREMHGYCTRMIIITARRSYASAVLGVAILSACPSICHTRALWIIQRTYQRYFIPHERAILLVVGRRRPLVIEVTPSPSKIALVNRFPPNKRNFVPVCDSKLSKRRAVSLLQLSYLSNNKATAVAV